MAYVKYVNAFPHAYIKYLQLVEQHDGPLDSLRRVAELVAPLPPSNVTP